jgi:flagellar biosynthesis/type III secretory pathway chaperone
MAEITNPCYDLHHKNLKNYEIIIKNPESTNNFEVDIP